MEDRCFKVTQKIECLVYANDKNEAERFAKSAGNWDGWSVMSVDSVIEVDEETGEPV